MDQVRHRLAACVIAVAMLSSACTHSLADPSDAPPAIPSASQSSDYVTDEQLDEAFAKSLDNLAKALDIDPPQVAVVREIRPSEDEQVQAECMTAAGFPVDEDGDPSGPPEQREAFYLAWYTCIAQYPVAKKYRRPFNTAQIGLVHEYYRDSLVPCLQSHGFAPGPVPTLETFLATARTAEEYNPYDGVTERLREEERRELLEACPPLPPEDVLYG